MKLLTEVSGPREAKGDRPKAGPVYRAAYADSASLEGNPVNLYEAFRASVKTHANRPALGWRPQPKGGAVQGFTFMTYKEMDTLVTNVGSALDTLGVGRNSSVGIYAINSPEWMLAMKGTDRQGATCVPLYDTFGKEAVEYIIGHSECKVVFCSGKSLKEFAKALPAAKSRLVQVVVWGDVADDVLQEAEQSGVPITVWDKFVAFGASDIKPAGRATGDDICTIMYTSGTTGQPKGVAISNDAVMATIGGLLRLAEHFKTPITEADVFLSYLPLAHIFGRVVEETFLVMGGSIGYWQGDPRKLMDDIGELKPTVFVGVPRIFDRIYSGITEKVKKAGWVQKAVFDSAFALKQALMAYGFETLPCVDGIVFGEVKKRLGGRVKIVVSGGAPLADHVESFLKVTMCCPVAQGYGLTETMGASFISNPHSPSEKHTVGIPLPGVQLRLEAVPEMGYDPCAATPRGEVCIRGRTLFKGYHKAEDKTAEVVDEDGFFHTGDIGELNSQGALSVIDRLKNFFKLAHGEYVAAEKIENVLKKVNLVDQVWVYGDSKRAQLVAVVVPDKAALSSWASSAGLPTDFKELCKNPKAAEYVQAELEKSGRADDLKGFEVAKRVYLETEQFAVENDLMTPSFKLKRPQLKKRYEKEIKELYSTLE